VTINVPDFARAHFWEEPPPGTTEFWGFRFPPPCKPGDRLVFKFDGEAVAEAVVHAVVAPGQSRCDRTGKFNTTHNVFWRPETFVDLRNREAGPPPVMRDVWDCHCPKCNYHPLPQTTEGYEHCPLCRVPMVDGPPRKRATEKKPAKR
jgi:hypothetical protein